MSDATEQEQKRPLTLARTGARLELRKGVETGQVRQSFSHGRSKTVTVEVRKKRMIGAGVPDLGRPEPALTVAREAAPTARPHPARAGAASGGDPAGADRRGTRRPGARGAGRAQGR